MKQHSKPWRGRAAALAAAAAIAAGMAGGTPAACAVEEETVILLSDSGVQVDGTAASTDASAAVYTGADIIYYQDGTGETYGEGTEEEKHTPEEAAAHTVVTITRPGVYRLSGTLSKGQIFVDLGEDAKTDPEAVVTLILDNVDITCTVAPAVFFYRVYECDQAWVAYDEGESETYQASGNVDTSAAGANVVLAAESENTVAGSHVARIYKEGTTKKLHKYDGAFYSRMSMNIDGTDNSGTLTIIADNEGLDSELHLTINGGAISIEAQDDGINTNEDGVSVTTVNGGHLTVSAGLGAEGDGIDSNGYLTINGGTVWTMANERSPDGGIDADCDITINGGNVYAFGTRNDAVSSSSAQPYLELFFASTLPAGSEIAITGAAGDQKMAFTLERDCQSMTLSLDAYSKPFADGETYYVYVNGIQQQYTGSRAGGMGGPRPDGMEPPEGMEFPAGMEPPEEFRGGRPGGGPGFGSGQEGEPPEGMTPPNGEAPSAGWTPPDGWEPHRGPGGGTEQDGGEASVNFTLTADTCTFSGISDWPEAAGKTAVTFQGLSIGRNGAEVNLDGLAAVTLDGETVDLDPGDIQITVTDVPSEDYAMTCLLSDGMEAVQALLPQDSGRYRITVAVASANPAYAGVLQRELTVGGLPFSDVDADSSTGAAVQFVYERGLMDGTGNGQFSPNGTVTRAQAVTVLARLAGAEPQTAEAFSDVPVDAWYSGYVGWAVEKGIVQGDGQGHFLPESPVTGAQMADMIRRYTGQEAPDSGSGEPLTRAALAAILMELAGGA